MPTAKPRERRSTKAPRTAGQLDHRISARRHDKSLAAIMARGHGAPLFRQSGETYFGGGSIVSWQLRPSRGTAVRRRSRTHCATSTNLVFIRIMRDVVRHYMLETSGLSALVLEDSEDPRRRHPRPIGSGGLFTNRFYAKYRGKKPEEVEAILLVACVRCRDDLRRHIAGIHPTHPRALRELMRAPHGGRRSVRGEPAGSSMPTPSSSSISLDRGWHRRHPSARVVAGGPSDRPPGSGLPQHALMPAPMRASRCMGWLFRTRQECAGTSASAACWRSRPF